MNEIKALISKAEKYLSSAELLIDHSDFDSAISRMYYAMFFSAEAVLLNKQMSFSSHKGVISAFGQHFIKTEIFPKEMGRELNRAFEKRQLCDYGIDTHVSIEQARKMLNISKDFVDRISKWLKM